MRNVLDDKKSHVRPGQEQTKAKLLKAALDVFAKDGYDAATTRKIAKRAGVNESLIHRYFDSKLGLFLAVKNQYREKFLNEYLASENSGPLEDEIIKVMSCRLRRSPQDKKFFKLVIARAILDPKVRMDAKKMAGLTPPEVFERFRRFKKEGLLRDDVSVDSMVNIIHAFSFTLAILTDAIECASTDDALELVRLFAKIVAAGAQKS